MIMRSMPFNPKIMKSLLRPKWQNAGILNPSHFLLHPYSTSPPIPTSTSNLEKLCHIVSHGVGSLDDLETNLNELNVSCCSSTITQVLDHSKREAPARRLLRFFLWSQKQSDVVRLEDKVYNHAIKVFAEKKDFVALDMLISNLGKENRAMESSTFSIVAETLVKLGRVDEALGIFKNLDNKFMCPQDSSTVTAIVAALCSKGHVKRAEGVVYHHKDKTSSVKLFIYRNLLHGWSVQENVKESRRVIKDMKGAGIAPDLFCYNTFLKCVCRKNLKANPSGLVPEALNVMIEMRTYGIEPNTISYNVLLSCLGRTRRVKESIQILNTMKKTGCSPDWTSYYLVARVLYLTGRFGKGKQMVDEMIEEGLIPERKFYYDLIGILCGVERVNYALELFELMKKSSLGGYETVYDLLIPKLCRSGEFGKGRELWDEARAMGLTLECSSDVLNPLITKVFKPIRKVEKEVVVVESLNRKTGGKMKPIANVKKGKKLFFLKKKGKKFMVHKKKKTKAST